MFHSMNVLFIYPIAPPEVSEMGFQQGIGCISAMLKQKGHKTALLCLSSFNRSVIRKKILSFKPDIIAISSTSDYIPLVREFVGFVKKEYDIPIVLGGVHATIAPEDAIKIPGLLGIFRGEGEYAFTEFVDAFEQKRDFSKIQNFWFKEGKSIVRNEIRHFIDDLDTIPFPDRELFDFQELIKQRKDAEFMGSRGCPFQCTYCINHSLIKLYSGKGRFVRYRSVDNLLREMKEVISRYDVKMVGLHDDTFTLNKAWLEEFCKKYPVEVNLPFWCNARVDTVNKEIAEILKRAGCVEVRMAIESGNEDIRQRILKKNASTGQIIKAFDLVHAAGMTTFTFNMIGLPYETEENIKETIRLNRRVNPSVLQVSIFRPYPYTELFDICKKNGWISNRKLSTYFDKVSMLNLPTISQDKLAYYFTT